MIGPDGERLFALKPDAVIGELDERPIVLDTKWKRLTPRKSGCERTMGIAPSDIYQVLAYARAHDAKRLVLLYPWHREMDGPPGLNRRWTVTGSDCSLDIATVDVGRPDEIGDALRRIIKSDTGPPTVDNHTPLPA